MEPIAIVLIILALLGLLLLARTMKNRKDARISNKSIDNDEKPKKVLHIKKFNYDTLRDELKLHGGKSFGWIDAKIIITDNKLYKSPLANTECVYVESSIVEYYTEGMGGEGEKERINKVRKSSEIIHAKLPNDDTVRIKMKDPLAKSKEHTRITERFKGSWSVRFGCNFITADSYKTTRFVFTDKILTNNQRVKIVGNFVLSKGIIYITDSNDENLQSYIEVLK